MGRSWDVKCVSPFSVSLRFPQRVFMSFCPETQNRTLYGYFYYSFLFAPLHDNWLQPRVTSCSRSIHAGRPSPGRDGTMVHKRSDHARQERNVSVCKSSLLFRNDACKLDFECYQLGMTWLFARIIRNFGISGTLQWLDRHRIPTNRRDLFVALNPWCWNRCWW